MLIQTLARSKDFNVTVTDVPGQQSRTHVAVWQDDFDGIGVTQINQNFLPTTFEEVASPFFMIAMGEENVLVAQIFSYDTALITHVDADADSEAHIRLIEADPHGALEIGDDFDGVSHFRRDRTDEPWSIPRYIITGQTVDGVSGAVLTGVTVRVYWADSDTLEQLVVSDGSGNFSLPIFDQRPRMIVAHSGSTPSGVTRRDIFGT
jgi:hypothetical protein